jgi:hypothetical protein
MDGTRLQWFSDAVTYEHYAIEKVKYPSWGLEYLRMVAETFKVFSEQDGRISIRSNFNDADLDLVMLRKQVARILDIESVAFESYRPPRYVKVRIRHAECPG